MLDPGSEIIALCDSNLASNISTTEFMVVATVVSCGVPTMVVIVVPIVAVRDTDVLVSEAGLTLTTTSGSIWGVMPEANPVSTPKETLIAGTSDNVILSKVKVFVSAGTTCVEEQDSVAAPKETVTAGVSESVTLSKVRVFVSAGIIWIEESDSVAASIYNYSIVTNIVGKILSHVTA